MWLQHGVTLVSVVLLLQLPAESLTGQPVVLGSYDEAAFEVRFLSDAPCYSAPLYICSSSRVHLASFTA